MAPFFFILTHDGTWQSDAHYFACHVTVRKFNGIPSFRRLRHTADSTEHQSWLSPTALASITYNLAHMESYHPTHL